MFGKYSADVNKMDNFRSYELVLNGKTYDISREVAAGYNSRYFSVVTENGTIPASFIYSRIPASSSMSRWLSTEFRSRR